MRVPHCGIRYTSAMRIWMTFRSARDIVLEPTEGLFTKLAFFLKALEIRSLCDA
jgi:hypothetical protein